MLDRHVPCESCSYDLFGLEEDTRCPECGTAITESLRRIRNTGLRLDANEIVRLIVVLKYLKACVFIGLIWGIVCTAISVLLAVSMREVLLLGWLLILIQTARYLWVISPRASIVTGLAAALAVAIGVLAYWAAHVELLLMNLVEVWQLLILLACVLGAYDLRKQTGHNRCGTNWQFPAAAFLLALICYGVGFFWQRGNIHPTAALALFVTILATLRIIWQARRVLTKCLPAGYTSDAR